MSLNPPGPSFVTAGSGDHLKKWSGAQLSVTIRVHHMSCIFALIEPPNGSLESIREAPPEFSQPARDSGVNLP